MLCCIEVNNLTKIQQARRHVLAELLLPTGIYSYYSLLLLRKPSIIIFEAVTVIELIFIVYLQC